MKGQYLVGSFIGGARAKPTSELGRTQEHDKADQEDGQKVVSFTPVAMAPWLLRSLAMIGADGPIVKPK